MEMKIKHRGMIEHNPLKITSQFWQIKVFDEESTSNNNPPGKAFSLEPTNDMIQMRFGSSKICF